MKYVIYNVLTGTWWTGSGWSKDKSKATRFAYRMFASIAAAELNGGKGMRVEKV